MLCAPAAACIPVTLLQQYPVITDFINITSLSSLVQFIYYYAISHHIDDKEIQSLKNTIKLHNRRNCRNYNSTDIMKELHSNPVIKLLLTIPSYNQQVGNVTRMSSVDVCGFICQNGPMYFKLSTSKLLSRWTVARVAKVLWTSVMQVLRKFRSYSVHIAPLETAGIFNVEMIPYCGQM